MTTRYTSFQIKNTASVPMFVSLKDPDGNSYDVGPLDQGEESIQVAPIGTIWSIQFGSFAAQEKANSEEDIKNALFADRAAVGRTSDDDDRGTDGAGRGTDGAGRDTDVPTE
jgi:hypothetical protein